MSPFAQTGEVEHTSQPTNTKESQNEYAKCILCA